LFDCLIVLIVLIIKRHDCYGAGAYRDQKTNTSAIIVYWRARYLKQP